MDGKIANHDMSIKIGQFLLYMNTMHIWGDASYKVIGNQDGGCN